VGRRTGSTIEEVFVSARALCSMVADAAMSSVDAAGTRCAIAHLIEAAGEGALVAEIARTRNNAWVREPADDPRVVAWLDANGLTLEEAARIQPSYEETAMCPPSACAAAPPGTSRFRRRPPAS
jgi:hypothetical protein